MLNIQGKMISLLLVAAAALSITAGSVYAATAEDLNKDAKQALQFYCCFRSVQNE